MTVTDKQKELRIMSPCLNVMVSPIFHKKYRILSKHSLSRDLILFLRNSTRGFVLEGDATTSQLH